MSNVREILADLPSDLDDAINHLLKHYDEFNTFGQDEPIGDHFYDFADYYLALYLILGNEDIASDSHGYPRLTRLDLTDKSPTTLKTITSRIKSVREKNHIIMASRDFDNRINEIKPIIMKRQFTYEFSPEEIKSIQLLIDELRNMVTNSSLFTDEHKRRLLLRLENLQKELHKRLSDLDKFWGNIFDLGVVIGRFGKEVKPFVDRVRELKDIVWGAQARAEGIDSSEGPPLLTGPDKD